MFGFVYPVALKHFIITIYFVCFNSRQRGNVAEQKIFKARVPSPKRYLIYKEVITTFWLIMSNGFLIFSLVAVNGF